MALAGTAQQMQQPRSLTTAVLPRRVKRALDNVLAIAANELRRQLQAVLMDTEHELARQAERAQTVHLRDLYEVALHKTRGVAARFPQVFMDLVEDRLAALDPRLPRPDLRCQQADGQGLSLVDEDSTSEHTVLYDLSSRHEARNGLALQLMGHRFGVLAGSPAFDAEHLPFGPHAIGDALYQASIALDLPLEARLAIYQFYDRSAMSHYSTLLDTMNARLADDGILPHLSFVPVRLRPPGADSAPRNAPSPGQGTPQSTAGTGGGHAPQQATAGAGLSSAMRSGFAALQNLLAKRRNLLAKLRPGSADERLRDPLPANDVLSALKRLRAANPRQGSVSEVRQSLLAQARQALGRGVKLVDGDEDCFELLDMFHTQLGRELRPGSAGEAMVQRLRLPLLQLGLQDREFFVDPGHPARQLIDTVAAAGARWAADDDFDGPMLDLLRQAVDTVQQDPDARPETFAAANEALRKGLQAQARKIEIAERRQVDAARGRDRLELARMQAAEEIARMVGGRELPKFSATLLEQAWADALTLSLLRHGDDSEAWHRLRGITARLVEACTGGMDHAPDPELVANVQETLGQVGYHEEDAAVIARMLASGGSDDGALVSRTELVMQMKSRARLGEHAMGLSTPKRAPRNAEEQAAWERLCALPEGSWIEIMDSADNSVRRVKLAWLSTRTGQVLLLNRRGQKVDAGDLDTLARQSARGALRVVEQPAGPAESAWQSMLANLRRIAGDGGRS